MRWSIKREPIPKGGDKRTRTVFAWKPTEAGQHTVWFESYYVEERYFQPAGGNQGWWSETVRYPKGVRLT